MSKVTGCEKNGTLSTSAFVFDFPLNHKTMKYVRLVDEYIFQHHVGLQYIVISLTLHEHKTLLCISSSKSYDELLHVSYKPVYHFQYIFLTFPTLMKNIDLT